MARKIAYWISTVIVAGLSLLAARSYLPGDPPVMQAFERLGYPQQLRIILGIAKPLAILFRARRRPTVDGRGAGQDRLGRRLKPLQSIVFANRLSLPETL